MYEAAVADGPTSWTQAEDSFLRAMEGFDDNVMSGLANQGDIQNGKGDFFNDLLALILERCAGTPLDSRGRVPGLIFPGHNLDVTFPSEGIAEFLLEAKAVGIPRHPRNPRQPNPLGRPGAADLPKRIKEAGFKTIDLKAEYGRRQAQQGQAPGEGPGGNLTSWLRMMKPKSYLFIAARVVSESDLQATITLAGSAAQVMDGVGVYCYRPVAPDKPTSYGSVGVPRPVELDPVLYRACQDIIGAKTVGERPSPTEPSAAEASKELLEDLGVGLEDDDDEETDA